MKKIISLVAVAAMMLAMAGCAVNSSTGSITVMNSSDKDAQNIKVGSVNIGFVAKGATKTVYFFKEETDASISANGYEAYTNGLSGIVNLKFDYMYTFNLYQSTTNSNYFYYIQGTATGDKVGTENLR